MKIFNGNFFGSRGEEENSQATVLTIQYLGDKSWAFQMNSTESNSKRRKLGEEEVKAAIVSHLQGLTTNSALVVDWG